MNGTQVDKVELVDLGTISSITCKPTHTEFFYAFSSFLRPTTIFRYDFTKPKEERHTVFRLPAIKDYNSDEFESKQIFYPSKDGTMIPMFLVYRKGLVLDGNNPLWLYGYGSTTHLNSVLQMCSLYFVV